MGIELLAPGGSFDAVKAAVSSGADAVYIGASRFSARQNAINFDSDELKRAVSYCHIRGVKVYLAINTLIHDNEFCEALSVAKEAYESGIDAYIVQDLGLCQALSENFDAPVHGSTQMTVFDENGLDYLKKMGIKRAVLSRECRKAEIADMAKTSGMELEVFCHGAICMSYSGQCLMSSFLGGRSANRGECAQPCRLPYSIEGKSGYFLSPRDLSLLSEIPDLIKMGVSSLKIEGRMKGPSYVASAVTAFRKTIDRGYADEEDKERLVRAFSRGGEFTKGCYGGIKGVGMMNITSSNDDVLKTNDAALIKELKHLWEDGKEIKKIPVDMSFSVFDEETSLTLSDGENYVAVMCETDKSGTGKAIDEEFSKAQLTKLGATPYVAESFTADIKTDAYFKTSALNALRREATEKLSGMREKTRVFAGDVELPLIKESEKEEFSVYITAETIEQAEALIEEGAENVFVPYSLTGKTQAKGVYIPAVYGKLPERIEEEYILAGSIGAAEYGIKMGKKVIADYSMNISNAYSAARFEKAVLSAELNLKQIKNIADKMPCLAFAYGYLPLMKSRNCVIKTAGKCDGKGCASCEKSIYLKDRKDVKFFVKSDGEFNTLYNSVPIFMADRISELKNSKISGIRLMFTKESPEECVKIYRMYTDEEKALTPKNYTRGYFYK